MTTLMEETLGQMISERPARARIFDETGIDYGRGANQTLAEACRHRGVDPDNILDRLTELDQKEDSSVRNWAEAPLGDLCDCIEQVFHASLRRELPRVGMLLYYVAEAHGDHHPELRRVLDLYSHLSGDMKLHMTIEEEHLFPLIKAVEAGEANVDDPMTPIMQMEVEHDEMFRRLEEIRQLTLDFQVPADACSTYREALSALHDLEADLNEHVSLENNILFPRVAQLQFAPETVYG